MSSTCILLTQKVQDLREDAQELREAQHLVDSLPDFHVADESAHPIDGGEMAGHDTASLFEKTVANVSQLIQSDPDSTSGSEVVSPMPPDILYYRCH